MMEESASVLFSNRYSGQGNIRKQPHVDKGQVISLPEWMHCPYNCFYCIFYCVSFCDRRC